MTFRAAIASDRLEVFGEPMPPILIPRILAWRFVVIHLLVTYSPWLVDEVMYTWLTGAEVEARSLEVSK